VEFARPSGVGDAPSTSPTPTHEDFSGPTLEDHVDEEHASAGGPPPAFSAATVDLGGADDLAPIPSAEPPEKDELRDPAITLIGSLHTIPKAEDGNDASLHPATAPVTYPDVSVEGMELV
jgi:hypothetical protein